MDFTFLYRIIVVLSCLYVAISTSVSRQNRDENIELPLRKICLQEMGELPNVSIPKMGAFKLGELLSCMDKKYETLRNFACYIRCAANLRMTMEQLSTRFMKDSEKKKRSGIHLKIGNFYNQRKVCLFHCVTQFAGMIVSESEMSSMDSKKKNQVEIEWTKLKKMRIRVVDEKSKNYDILVRFICDLIEVETFDEAFSIYVKNQSDLWSLLNKELFRDGRKKQNIEFDQQPETFKQSIEILSRSVSLTIDDLLKEIGLSDETDRLYATLVLEKSKMEGCSVLELSSEYVDVAWIFIYRRTEEPIAAKRQAFCANKNVQVALKDPKQSPFQNPYLNTVNLYGDKYVVLQKVNSLLAFHPPDQGLVDSCPIGKENFQFYAKKISQEDPILATVAEGLLVQRGSSE